MTEEITHKELKDLGFYLNKSFPETYIIEGHVLCWGHKSKKISNTLKMYLYYTSGSSFLRVSWIGSNGVHDEFSLNLQKKEEFTRNVVGLRLLIVTKEIEKEMESYRKIKLTKS